MSTPSTKVVSADAKTILLIEDDEAHALLIRRAFESHPEGYVIDVVRTLREARDALGHRIPALVIADYRLPDGEGVELLQAQSNVAPVYPVVIMTGHGDEHLAVESMRAGALDYIVKSDASMGGMPRTADRVLREWHHIEQRRKAEQALALSEERYALAAEATNDGLWDWNLETNTVYYSPRLKAMLGFGEGDFDDTLDAVFGLVHERDVGLLRAAIDSHLSGGTPHLECECRMRNNDGDFRWMMMRGLAVRYSDGVAYRMAGSLTDIHERKRAEQQLQHDALHDALTGLPNRALFMDRLSRCLERAHRRNNYLFAVLFLDLDRFKVVNDSLGHMVGDELLKAVANRLIDCLRTGDTVCRFGGDEFGLVLDGIDREEEAMQIAKRIALSVEQTYRLSDDEVFTTASIGIALGSKEADSAESLIHNADTAMFRAKAHGRGYVELFKGTMHMDALKQLHRENDLRRIGA
ncbi:MAG: diguanylate cyclase domain-containing protein [Candidatus Thiodiazotropha endolucinida]